MKVLFLMLIACSFASDAQTQTKGSGNSSLDSLKQGVKNLGRLFKKASIIQLNIANAKREDARVVSLADAIQQLPGVTRFKQFTASTDVAFEIAYKGKPGEFWKQVPAAEKKNFKELSISDSSIVISYPTPATTATILKEKPSRMPPILNDGQEPVNNKAKPENNATTTGEVALTKGTALLFANVKSSLSNTEKNLIFKSFNVKLSKNGQQFVFEEGEAYPFDAAVFPVDLNKDGKEEIFIVFGNTYTSGMTGSSVIAYFPGKKGGFDAQLGFPGTTPDVLSTSNLSYPDLLIGGPGFVFPVQRWNGQSYEFYRKVSDKEMMKMKMTNLEDISKVYTSKF